MKAVDAPRAPKGTLAFTLDWRDPRFRQQVLLAAALVLGVMLLLAGQLRDRRDRVVSPPVPAAGEAALPALSVDPLDPMATRLAARLENILSTVQGTGRVRVEIHLQRGPHYEYAANQVQTERRTEEQDSGGGRRTTTEQRDERDLLVGRGESNALITQVEASQIAGVLVVAEGASDDRVRAALVQAVATYLDVPVHRVMVLAGDPNRMRGSEQ